MTLWLKGLRANLGCIKSKRMSVNRNFPTLLEQQSYREKSFILALRISVSRIGVHGIMDNVPDYHAGVPLRQINLYVC